MLSIVLLVGAFRSYEAVFNEEHGQPGQQLRRTGLLPVHRYYRPGYAVARRRTRIVEALAASGVGALYVAVAGALLVVAFVSTEPGAEVLSSRILLVAGFASTELGAEVLSSRIPVPVPDLSGVGFFLMALAWAPVVAIPLLVGLDRWLWGWHFLRRGWGWCVVRPADEPKAIRTARDVGSLRARDLPASAGGAPPWAVGAALVEPLDIEELESITLDDESLEPGLPQSPPAGRSHSMDRGPVGIPTLNRTEPRGAAVPAVEVATEDPAAPTPRDPGPEEATAAGPPESGALVPLLQTPYAEVVLAPLLAGAILLSNVERGWLYSLVGFCCLALSWVVRLVYLHNRSLGQRVGQTLLRQTLRRTAMAFAASLFLIVAGFVFADRTVGRLMDWLVLASPLAEADAELFVSLSWLAGALGAFGLSVRAWLELRGRVICEEAGSSLRYRLVGAGATPIGGVRTMASWSPSADVRASSVFALERDFRKGGLGEWAGSWVGGLIKSFGAGAVVLKAKHLLYRWRQGKDEDGAGLVLSPRNRAWRISEVHLRDGEEAYIRLDRIVGVVCSGAGPSIGQRLDARIEHMAAAPVFLPVVRGPGRILVAHKPCHSEQASQEPEASAADEAVPEVWNGAPVPFSGLIVVPQDCGLGVSSDTSYNWSLSQARYSTFPGPSGCIVEPAHEGAGFFSRLIGLFFPWS